MKLIDTDELNPIDKIITIKSTGEKCVYLKIDNVPIVNAIPVKWLEAFSKQQDKKQYKDFLEFMLNYWSMHRMHALELWRKENG